MTHRADEDQQRQPRLVLHGSRTRVAIVLIGLLISTGVPAVILGTPTPTVDGHAVGTLADPAGLGVTGALPGNPLAANADPSVVPTTVSDEAPADSASVGLPSIPTPPMPDGPLGIPGVVLDAYQFAQRTLADIQPGCHLSWSVLAGIGRIESNHASDGRVDAFGNTLGPILGPRLDGSPGLAAIPDTDHGVLDQDTVWDRAVGPMQFIPSSWRNYGVDGNGDGVANPNNTYDSTVATGLYLCAGAANLSDPAQLQAAVFRYNHSAIYVNIVLLWAQAYLTNVIPTPSAPGPIPPGTNGNGGEPILPDSAPLAAPPPAAIAQSAPLLSPLGTTPSLPSPSPVVSTTPSPTSLVSPAPSPTPAPTPTSTLTQTPTSTETPPPPTESTPTPTPVPVTTTTPSPAEATPTPSPVPTSTPISTLPPAS
jgi:Transglycosylase SLT domain